MSKRKRPPAGRNRPIRPATVSGSPSGTSSDSGTGPYWIYGTHAVLAALDNPARRCQRLVATRAEADRLDTVPAVARRGIGIEVAERHEIERWLTPGAVHQGLALLTDPLDEPGLEAALPAPETPSVVMVLDQVTDPRNVGAALRAAAAFGARAVIMQSRHAPPETGALAKAASGALEVVPLVRVTNLSRALKELQDGGFWCLGLAGQADGSLVEADLSGHVALVLGSEGSGLRRLTIETCDQVARIPITGNVESLNLATAAAVALYEWARRKL